MKLRTTVTAAMIGVGAVAVAVSVALVVLTSSLQRTSVTLEQRMQRVRLLTSLETDALQSVREGEPRIEQARRTIGQLRDQSAPEERVALQQLDDSIARLASARTLEDRDASLDVLSRQLRALVDREDLDAERAVAAAASADLVAKRIGIAAVGILLFAVAGVLGWVWRRALQPIVTLVEAIDRVAKGDANARAPERGPTEVRQVSAAFNQMASALGRQRDEQLAFIGGVAHDLRTPLNALQMAAGLLGESPAEVGRTRERIQRQIARLDRMIGDLLDRTRIEAGRFDLNLAACDLGGIVARAVDGHRDPLSTRVLRFVQPDEPLLVRCDPLRIEQVIGNLLTNALKYSPDSTDVDITLEREGPMAMLSVADHGIGISTEDRIRIFEPFRRGANVGSVGGAGLGLSVTRRLVEAHGGQIDVRSEPGHGSVFVVRLPLAQAGSHVQSV